MHEEEPFEILPATCFNATFIPLFFFFSFKEVHAQLHKRQIFIQIQYFFWKQEQANITGARRTNHDLMKQKKQKPKNKPKTTPKQNK